jgi:hypothetical protein
MVALLVDGLRYGAGISTEEPVGTHHAKSIDSTAIKAHLSASGKKGAVRKPLAARAAGAQRKSTLSPTTKAAR